MTSAADFIHSTMSSLVKARGSVLALSTDAGQPTNPRGYEKACPNSADARCLARAVGAINDATFELNEAQKLAIDDAAELKRMHEVNNDLLAACKAALDYLENGESNVGNRRLIPNIERLRAAIARATPTEAK